MKISLESPSQGYTIRAYGPEGVTVVGPAAAGGEPEAATTLREERLTRSFAISPDRLLRDWPPQRFDELRAADFAALLALEPELVLFGSGDSFRLPAPALLAPLAERGLGVEVMDTGAACRTYAVLAAEGRRVVAALLVA